VVNGSRKGRGARLYGDSVVSGGGNGGEICEGKGGVVATHPKVRKERAVFLERQMEKKGPRRGGTRGPP